jgi:DNA-binding beta-propeller fold protein YncE
LGLPAEFGSAGEGAAQFNEPRGVAVDQESGAVYVVDRENSRAEKWSGEGVFDFAWGWGVADGSTAAPQTCVVTCFAGLSGGGAGQFRGFPSGVAVDNSLGLGHGDVYVADRENFRVQKFSPTGEFMLMFGKNVNATTHGEVCVAGEACQSGEEGPGLGEFRTLGSDVVSVDSTGKVYVGELDRVQEFSAGGIVEGEIALPGIGVIESLVVDSAKDVYVTASGLEGVHKYDGAGAELDKPRDPTGIPSTTSIAVGPSDELFLYDSGLGHVLEFDPAGVQVASFVAESSEGGSGGIAYSSDTKALYVLGRTGVRVIALPPPGPAVLAGSEGVAELLPTSAQAHAFVNPEGPEATSYHFEYGPTAAYGSSTTPVKLTGGAFEDQPASGSLTALSPSTVYHFRLVVSNSAHTTFGPDQTFTSLPPVSIESESVSQVTSESARLQTALNAHGVPSVFRFEYGTTTAYGHSIPAPDGDAGSAATAVPFSLLVEGLEAHTTYHYRVVATNKLGEARGPDQIFVTQDTASGALADGRGYELVSPPNKHGVALEALAKEGSDIQAAEDGHAITYIAKAPISSATEGSRSALNTQLLAIRGASGWGTEDITTPHEEVVGLGPGNPSEYQLFSNDLSVAAVQPSGTTPLAPSLMGEHGERTPYRREANGQYTPLVTASHTPAGVKFGGEESQPGVIRNDVGFVSMTPDGSRIVLDSPQPLVPRLVTGGHHSLYEWSAGRLQLVSVLPNGRPAAEEGLSAALGNGGLQVRGAVSHDGSRVVFTTEEEHLFVHDVVRGESVQLDVPATGVKPGNGVPVFQIANGSGSRVFFTDAARLTVGASAKESKPDLYVCDLTVVAGHLSCALRDLTVDFNPNEAANVLGDAIGIDDGGRYVYFVANGALTPGAAHGQCRDIAPYAALESASCNLYMHDVDTGVTSLVGVLSNRDAADWEAGNGRHNLEEMTSGVSSNGRFVAFMSSRSLTGFDNRDMVSGEPDAEVFEFDRENGSIRCVSCNGSGGRPAGVFDPFKFPGLLADRQQRWGGEWVAGSLPGWTNSNDVRALYRSRYLADSGRLFFNSPVGLVPSDSNGREDVYEYEPGGVGGCALPSGCVALMSGGSSNEESVFLDASVSGDDVFFLTAAKLAPRDTDGALDVYDAHVCSASIPCPSGAVSVPPPCTTADSCRVAPVGQPELFGAPASSTFRGGGNGRPPVVRVVVKRLTHAQQLARALRACQSKPKRRRAMCKASARRRYGQARSVRGHAKKSGRGK